MAVICAGLAASSALMPDAKVDVVGTPDVLQSTSSASVDVDTKEDACKAENEATVTTADINGTAADDDITGPSSSTNAEHLDAGSICLLRLLSNASQRGTLPAADKSGAVFWKSSWRQHLCRCPTCLVNFVDLICFYVLYRMLLCMYVIFPFTCHAAEM